MMPTVRFAAALYLLLALACAANPAPVAEEPDGPAATSASAPPAPEAPAGAGHGPESQSQTPPPSGHRHSDETDDATAHQTFAGDEWVSYWDRPGRKEWQKPEELVGALGLEPGMTVADIGAGSGYFNRYLSAAVGPEGLVLPVDIESSMVEHMRERAREEKTPNVRPVLAEPKDSKLPEGGVDVVLIVNTYHHIDDRLEYFERLEKVLRPGGRVAVVDFVMQDIPVGPSADHKLSREHVVGEFETIGYRLVDEPGILPYQYVLVFAPRQ
jgi:SAM-dependent methyltransferase